MLVKSYTAALVIQSKRTLQQASFSDIEGDVRSLRMEPEGLTENQNNLRSSEVHSLVFHMNTNNQFH